MTERIPERVTGAAWISFCLQASTTLVLAGSGVWAESDALLAGAVGGFSGALVCISTLWTLRMRQRVDRLENETRSATTRERHGDLISSEDDAVEQARAQLRRTERLTPGLTSLAVMAVLSVGAAWIWSRLAEDPSRGSFAHDHAPALPLAFLLLGSAFACFVVGRYANGLTATSGRRESRESAIALRSGASWMAGTALASLLLSIAFFIFTSAEVDTFLRVLAWSLPALWCLLAVETALQLLLGIYRPRGLRGFDRPAHDSRVLGLLSSPESMARTLGDALNYQFGFEVTRTWFYRLLERSLGRLISIGLAVLALLSTIVVVGPRERALVTRFGRLSRETLNPGLHWKLPWPISRAESWDTDSVRVIRFGSDDHGGDSGPILWSGEHAGHASDILIAAAPRRSDGSDTPDQQGIALVNAEVEVRYRIDPERLVDYVRASVGGEHGPERHREEDPEEPAADGVHGHGHGHAHGPPVEAEKDEDPEEEHDDDLDPADRRLRHLAVRETFRLLLTHDVDEWIGRARQTAGDVLRQRIQESSDSAGLGFDVLQVAVTSVHPPHEVADAFHAVISAEQEKVTRIENSQRRAIQLLAEVAGSVEQAEQLVAEIEAATKLRESENGNAEVTLRKEREVDRLLLAAGGRAAETIARARAARFEIESSERGQAARLSRQGRAFEQAPRLFKVRRLLEVLRESLVDARKVVVLSGHDRLTIRGDFKSVEQGFDLSTPPAKEDD